MSDDNVASEDEALEKAARLHLKESADAQIGVELLEYLEAAGRPWWSVERRMEIWPTRARMEWLTSRPDVRSRVVSELTQVSAAASSKLTPSVQTDLLAAVVEAGDVSAQEHEAAFEPQELATHAPHGEVLSRVREEFPWKTADDDDKRALAWLINTLMGDQDGRGNKRAPVLTPLILRSAIDAMSWARNMPVKLRAAVDQARLRGEWEDNGKSFSAKDELAIITVEKIVESLPPKDLKPVVEAAERVLFTIGQSEIEGGDTSRVAEATEEVGHSENSGGPAH